MKRRRSIILTLLCSLSLLFAPAFVLAGQAGAAQIFSTCGNGSAAGTPDVCGPAKTPPAKNPIVTILATAITIISYIVGAASVIVLVVSALRFITSGGDSNAVASARNGLVYALVGIAITALAQIFVAYILNKSS